MTGPITVSVTLPLFHEPASSDPRSYALSIIGLREVHTTTTGKAALVVLIPFAVVLVVLIVVVAAGIAVLSQR